MHALVGWLVFVGLVIAVRILAYLPAFRRVMLALGKRLGGWLLERFESPPVVDEAVEEMRAVIRAERLQADLRRVRRLVATDEGMSATRQIANRMAYAMLVEEYERHCREGYPIFTETAMVRVDGPAPVDRWRQASPVRYATRAPQVEVLEIGWRR